MSAASAVRSLVRGTPIAPRIRPTLLVGLSLVATLAVLAAPAAARGDALIIDHRCTKLEAIPPHWLEQAKLLTIHYAHTSHGSQIVSGVNLLESIDPTYGIAVRTSTTQGLPPVEDPPVLRMYDGNPPETYIAPDDYWDGEAALDRTRAVAASGNYMYSMWSWCGQQSSNSEATTRRYLDNMRMLESEYPTMRFILMTGHTDGSRETGTLNLRNNQVRDFATSNGMVLFDFADIESYDPDWNPYLAAGCNDNGDYDGGNWPDQWCADHAGSDLCQSCSCAHSKPLICNLKARAFWWMMARLAGWEGTVRCDADCDGDVDADDLSWFAACLAGPDAPPSPAGPIKQPAACIAAFDIDNDGDIDLTDFGAFQIEFTQTPQGPTPIPDP